MDRLDQLLRERAKQEPVPLPEDYAGRVFQTCAQLEEPEENVQFKGKGRRPLYRAWIAAAAALFVAVPNISPAAAEALAEVPVIGAVVEMVTFRTYTYEDGHSFADVVEPELDGSAAARELSAQIKTDIDGLVAQFQEECGMIGEGYQGLNVTCSVITDTPQWFTLRVDALETRASGYQFSRFYHIDRMSGTVAALADLFGEGTDYVRILSDEVLRQMKERMTDDGGQTYFVDEFTGIAPDQNFYWNEKGELVLFFDEYTIASGAMGTQEFTIPDQICRELRTPNV